MAPLKEGKLKMGDSTTVLRLLRGTAEDPTKPSWGGQFVRIAGRPAAFADDPDERVREGPYPGARTVNRWRASYLTDWAARMRRCVAPR